MSGLSGLKHMKKMNKAFGEGGVKKIKRGPIKEEDDEYEDDHGMDMEQPEGLKRQPEMMTENELINENEDLEYEDEYDDEFEKEDVEEEKSEHSSDYVTESEDEEDHKMQQEQTGENTEKQKRVRLVEKPKQKQKVTPFTGTQQNLGKEEVLEFENRAYDMLHRATTEFACLSCDWLTGKKSEYKIYKNEKEDMICPEYPLDVLAVAGSQASMPSRNQIYVLRFANLSQTKYDDDSERSDDEEEEIAEGNPIILQRTIPTKGAINRIRTMQGYPIVALWNEAAQVKIYDVQTAMDQLMNIDIKKLDNSKTKGIVSEDSSLLNHWKLANEGYGLEWSPLKLGRLVTGAVDGKINIFEAEDELCSRFTKENYYYSFHTDSVEDIQFSPTEPDAFATCSVDGTIKVCDMREHSYKQAQINIKAHDCDINVISWNPLMPNLIASGADDGSIKVFDLRYPSELPITNVKWHQEAITSIQWQPSDEWTLAAASADNRVSIWDFSVENNEQEVDEDLNVPEQVIFIHHGQEDIKELRWHPKYKDVLMTTAHSGFNIFKAAVNEDAPSEVDSEEENRLDIIPYL